MQQGIVEIAPFNKALDVDERTLVSLSDELDGFLRSVDGFRGRLLLRKNENEWMDVVFWRDRAASEAVMEKVVNSDACKRYFACMQGADHDDPGAGVAHWMHVKTYGDAGF